MLNNIAVGKLFGLEIRFRAAGLLGTVGLLIAFYGLFAAALAGQSPLALLLLAVAATVIHWVSGVVHHLGHAFAARQTGYPMSGITLGTWFGVLATSVYPDAEPVLPPIIHIRRALGGPLFSVLLTALFFVMLVAVPAGGNEAIRLVLLVGGLDNLLVYTLQLFVPFGFNDGTTLWKYVPALRQGSYR